jgi:hypothetical protein
MGNSNDHKEFRITSIKKTNTYIVPSVEMPTGKVFRRHNILEHHRVSIIANDPGVFPVDPEENEIAMKDRQLYIYSREGGILEWRPLGGGGGTVTTVPASSVIEDNDHRFINNIQLTTLQQLVDGQISANKIIEEPDKNFMTDEQVSIVNNLMDGVEVDGGDII